MPGRYDVIGDVHGQAQALGALLRAMGYRVAGGAWRHPDRTAVFVGDLIDRGHEQLEVLRTVRAMVEAGSARVVLGNHEFNAIAWTVWDDARGDYCRPHSPDKRRQHRAFLDAVGEYSAAHARWVAWFRTVPLWLDLGGLRVVHACWHEPSMGVLRPLLNAHGGVTDELVRQGTDKRGAPPAYDAVEVVLKGPEVALPAGWCYLDKGGTPRRRARQRWWDPGARTLRSAAVVPARTLSCDGGPLPPLPEVPFEGGVHEPYADPVPVLVGHYWFTGAPARIDERVACLDYSAVLGGQLVAYRWDGEEVLDDTRFVAVPGGPIEPGDPDEDRQDA